MNKEIRLKAKDMVAIYLELPSEVRQKAQNIAIKLHPELKEKPAGTTAAAGAMALQWYATNRLDINQDDLSRIQEIVERAPKALEYCQHICFEEIREDLAHEFKFRPHGIPYDQIEHPLMDKAMELEKQIYYRDNPTAEFEESLDDANGIEF